jgi:hypothetical protein
LENLKQRDKLRGLAVDETMILKWVLKKWGLRLCSGFIWLKIWPSDWLW